MSTIAVFSSSAIISQCLVVCVPRFSFSLTSLVLKLTLGLRALIKLDLPTPEFPHNAETLPSKSFLKASIPFFSRADVNTISYPKAP